MKERSEAEDSSVAYDMHSLKQMEENTGEMAKKTDNLKKLVLLSPAQLKALLPTTVAGIGQTAYKINAADGAFAEGNYQKDSITSVQLLLYDCAGEAGAARYVMSYWDALNVRQESEHEYTKTVDFKGSKAIENFKKDQKESSLTYVANDRLLVVLNGRNMEPSALKEAAQSLDLKL